MVVPIGDQAAQQVRAAQKRRIDRRRPAEHEVIAAAGSGVPPIEHELLGGKTRLTGGFVEVRRAGDELFPAVRGMNVDFDHTRIGGDPESLQARVARRLIAFDDDGMRKGTGGRFHGCHQLQIVLEPFRRRHEHIQHAVPRFRAHRCSGDPRGRLLLVRFTPLRGGFRVQRGLVDA